MHPVLCLKCQQRLKKRSLRSAFENTMKGWRVQTVRLFVNSLIAVLIAASVTPQISLAACGRGLTPTYRDIEAIRYERTNCFGECPSYEVLFTRDLGCYYVGSKYTSKLGTYKSNCSYTVLKGAIAVLDSHAFYALNYDSSVLVLDAPHYILSVVRCGVTTKLDWPAHDNRQDIESIFARLDAIANRLTWHKVSDSTESPLPLVASIP